MRCLLNIKGKIFRDTSSFAWIIKVLA